MSSEGFGALALVFPRVALRFWLESLAGDSTECLATQSCARFNWSQRSIPRLFSSVWNMISKSRKIPIIFSFEVSRAESCRVRHGRLSRLLRDSNFKMNSWNNLVPLAIDEADEKENLRTHIDAEVFVSEKRLPRSIERKRRKISSSSRDNKSKNIYFPNVFPPRRDERQARIIHNNQSQLRPNRKEYSHSVNTSSSTDEENSCCGILREKFQFSLINILRAVQSVFSISLTLLHCFTLFPLVPELPAILLLIDLKASRHKL